MPLEVRYPPPQRGSPPPLLRSLLFAPAIHERHSRKALASAADAAILDLEDAVAEGDKPAARSRAAALLAERAGPGPLALVRINGVLGPHAYPDLLAVVGPGLDMVVVPKAQSAEEVRTVAWVLDQLEGERGLAPGRIAILPIVETARGLARAADIAAASPRVWTVNFGVGDYALDTGLTPGPCHPGIAFARAQLVIACRVAGVDAPIDTAHLALDDPEGLEIEAREARRMGFQGKACIHPEQVGVVHRVFAPTADEVAWSRRIVEGFAAARAAGAGAARVGADFVDQPIVERAERTLALARRLGREEGAS